MSIENSNITADTSLDYSWTFNDVIIALRFISIPVDTPIRGFSIDSRSIEKGQAFIALKGDHTDGHDYLEEAYQKGATLAIVERSDLNALKNRSHLVVKDTHAALLDLAQYARERTAATIVGISGSVGKTTVRDWIYQILSHCGSSVSSMKNFNNHIGLPLSITNLAPTTKFGIFEIGIDRKDSMQPLATLCNPHVAVLTSIGQAHIENFESADALAYEKGLLFSGLACDGVAVIDYESHLKFPILNHLAKEYGAVDIVTVGDSPDANAYVVDAQYDWKTNHTVVKANLDGHLIEYSIQALGRHMVQDSLLSLVAAICSLYKENFSTIMHSKWSDIADLLLSSMPSLTPLSGRGQICHLTLSNHHQITLIDDSYNANISSMLAGISVLQEYHQASRRIAIIGDMYALGDATEEHHAKLFQALNENPNVDKVYAVGDLTHAGFHSLDSHKQGIWSHSVDDLLDCIEEELNNGDVVWIKGSNAVRLNKIVDKLKNSHIEADNDISIKKIA